MSPRTSLGLTSFAAILALVCSTARAQHSDTANDWLTLFDGATLAGWRAAENAASFRVVGGVIVCDGPRAHLFYVGAGDDSASFDDFEFSAEVRAAPGANSGIFFHTQWQEADWPAAGFEVQVNHSATQHGSYLELKKTGSLYGIRNVYKQLVADDAWFTLSFVVQKPRVTIRINGVVAVDYTEPAEPLPPGAPKLNRLGRGTFALQAHDPESVVHYRNLRVRRLPSGIVSTTPPPLDTAAAQTLALARDNFPLLDLHWPEEQATPTVATNLARDTGFGIGAVIEVGTRPNDETRPVLRAAIGRLKPQPVFVGIRYIPGRNERSTNDLLMLGDYVLAPGPSLKSTTVAAIEACVAQTVARIASEPIDIYTQAGTFPPDLRARYDEVWTESRMQRVVAELAQSEVALEINVSERVPSEKFLRAAKAAGVKFTIGSSGTLSSTDDYGYALELQKKLSLTWRDMFVPGHRPTRAQRLK